MFKKRMKKIIFIMLLLLLLPMCLNAQSQRYDPAKRKPNQSFGMCCLETGCALFIINAFITYTDYPYSDDFEESFIIMPNFNAQNQQQEDDEEQTPKDLEENPPPVFAGTTCQYGDSQFNDQYSKNPGNQGFMNLGFSYFNSFNEEMISYDVFMRGRLLSLLGYEFDLRHQSWGNTESIYFAGGVNVPLLQVDPVMFDFFIQYGRDENDNNPESGWVWGIKSFLYILDPISIESGFEAITFRDAYKYRMKTALSLHLSRIELIVGFEYYTDKWIWLYEDNMYDYAAVTGGAKVWF